MGDRDSSPEYELGIRAAARIESLSAAQLQMLEVVPALLSDPKVLLLDEPTTALGHDDVQRLHALIRVLAARGMGVVYVSHRLPEVLEVADRITVLRDGVSQGTYDAATMSEADVVALMIGRPLEMAFPTIAQAAVRRDAARRSPVYAATGSGRSTSSSGEARSSGSPAPKATAKSSCFAPWPASNRRTAPSRCAGKRVHLNTPPGAIRAGIILLSADRKKESIFTALSVRANATLQVLASTPRFGLRPPQAERGPVNGLVAGCASRRRRSSSRLSTCPAATSRRWR